MGATTAHTSLRAQVKWIDPPWYLSLYIYHINIFVLWSTSFAHTLIWSTTTTTTTTAPTSLRSQFGKVHVESTPLDIFSFIYTLLTFSYYYPAITTAPTSYDLPPSLHIHCSLEKYMLNHPPWYTLLISSYYGLLPLLTVWRSTCWNNVLGAPPLVMKVLQCSPSTNKYINTPPNEIPIY